MRRRDFITLVGGAAAWPLAARAQQPERMRRIAVLTGFAADDPLSQPWITAFVQELSELGWSDSRNLHIDYRWASADVEQIMPFAKELVALKPDVILAHSTPVTAALQRETTDIPIVFVLVSDPVGAGFVASLARPGGNITGFINFEDLMGGKWLELLKEVAPAVKRAAIMFNPDTSPGGGGYFLHSFEAAGAALGVKPIVAPVRSPSEIERVIGDLTREPDSGLVLLPDIFLLVNRKQVMTLAERHKLPVVYWVGAYAKEGGLLGYGPDYPDLFRRSASYVDRILKGEKPSNLPVQVPTKFELVINLKTAKALGLDVSLSLQQRADRVVE
ncbi:MAG: ABC transporter substrate-binding protein [Xanthobacteraceae bacterium]